MIDFDERVGELVEICFDLAYMFKISPDHYLAKSLDELSLDLRDAHGLAKRIRP
jgi:hypothetical protein